MNASTSYNRLSFAFVFLYILVSISTSTSTVLCLGSECEEFVEFSVPYCASRGGGGGGVGYTSYRHKEPEHRDEEFVWQIVRARLTAHTKFGLKCSGSLCL